MEEIASLKIFPKTRVKAFDGMSVTANTWSEAHEEHRQGLRAHNLHFHGSGIVYGLEVSLNDPPDQFVYISPGIAVDPAGNVIVLDETVAYDFSASVEGLVFLVIGHGERETGGVETETKYTHDEYVIAARPSIPKRPVVELARITLEGSGKAIKAPADPAHPKAGELDLRFRELIVPHFIQKVTVAICSLGEPNPDVKRGWDLLAKTCEQSNFYKLIIDTDVPFTTDFSSYDLVYLSGSGAFKLDSSEIKNFHSLVDAGKPILAEALDPAAAKSITALFEKLGINLESTVAGDSLFSTPYLFPAGMEEGIMQLGKVIYSSKGFSLAWSGKSAASRADIRSTHEWGINLINACIK